MEDAQKLILKKMLKNIFYHLIYKMSRIFIEAYKSDQRPPMVECQNAN